MPRPKNVKPPEDKTRKWKARCYICNRHDDRNTPEPVVVGYSPTQGMAQLKCPGCGRYWWAKSGYEGLQGYEQAIRNSKPARRSEFM